MSDVKAKMHQNQNEIHIPLGLCPRPYLGNVQLSPRPSCI